MAPARTYWPMEKLRGSLQPYVEQHGRLPPRTFFERNRRSDLIDGIRKNGGFQVVRSELGEEPLKRTGNRSYKIWENAKARLEELGFPPWQELRKLDGALADALQVHHGGYVEAKRKCGRKVHLGYSLRKWTNLEPLLLQIIDENNGDLPSSTVFQCSRDTLYRAIANAVGRHHGGFVKVRLRIGFKIKYYCAEKSLRHRENFDAILKPLVEKLGYFPTTNQLIALGLKRVVHAMGIYYGGVVTVRKEYGYPPHPRTTRYRAGKDLERVRAATPQAIAIHKSNSDVSEEDSFVVDGYGRPLFSADDYIETITGGHSKIFAATDKEGASVSIRSLLELYGMDLRAIHNNVIQSSDGSMLLVVSPYYSELVKPIPLRMEGNDLFLNDEQVWLVKLFIQLSSSKDFQKRDAIREIEQIAQRELTGEKALLALTLLRNAFMVEEDADMEREMDAVLTKGEFKDVLKQLLS